MGLDDVAAVDLPRAHAAIIWPLGAGEAILGPAIGPAVGPEQGVFLLQAKPRLTFGVGFHQPHGFVTKVEFVGASIGIPGLAQDQDIVTAAKGIGKDGTRADIDIRIAARRLSRR